MTQSIRLFRIDAFAAGAQQGDKDQNAGHHRCGDGHGSGASKGPDPPFQLPGRSDGLAALQEGKVGLQRRR